MTAMDKLSAFNLHAASIRNRIIEIGSNSPYRTAHFGGALSMVELITVIFMEHIRLKKEDCSNPDRDRFVLSKGHACLALYACLVEFGLLDMSEVNFEKNGSDVAGHPIINREKFIDFSTGSLGNGLLYSIGSCLNNPSRNVVCVMGDGELAEGSVWEGVRIAKRLNLNNLLAVVDCNGFQQTGVTAEINGIIDVGKVFEGFGWNTIKIDGHDGAELLGVSEQIHNLRGPTVIIADTIKGKGVEEIEGLLESHHTTLRDPRRP